MLSAFCFIAFLAALTDFSNKKKKHPTVLTWRSQSSFWSRHFKRRLEPPGLRSRTAGQCCWTAHCSTCHVMRLVWGENFKRSSADGSLSYIPRIFFSDVVHITANLRRWQLLDRRPLHTDNLDRQYWRCACQPWQNRLSLPWWVAGWIYLSYVLAGPILILPGEWQFYSCLPRIRLKIWCNSLFALPGNTLQCSALSRSYS